MKQLNISLEDSDHLAILQAKRRLMKKIGVSKLSWRDFILLVSERGFKW